MKPLRIMVTGSGSGVGQGIMKALRIGPLAKTIVGADIDVLNTALFRADESLLIPKVEEEGALARLIEVISDNKIDVVMIGSEFDLAFFSMNKDLIEKETGAAIIVSPYETVKVSDDKWLTAEFLRENNLPYPISYLPTSLDNAVVQAEELGYPVIIKSRTGTSSRHVAVVKNSKDLTNVYNSIPNPMIQQLIDLPSQKLKQEYTCSVFKCADGSLLDPFTARRTLRGGSSWVIEVDKFTELHSLLLAIGELLPCMGSLNVQLMIGPDGPIPFEFNARFSGTTAVRAHFGFNEPEFALQEFVLKEHVSEPVIRKGLAFRYLEEVFVEGVTEKELCPPLPRGEIIQWF